MLTIQQATKQAKDLVSSLTPAIYTYQNVVVVISLGERDEQEQVQCRLFLSDQTGLRKVHETFKASSFSRLLGKIETELLDVFQPEALEEFTLT